MEAKQYPIVPLKANSDHFKYIIFPKLLEGFAENEEIISKIDWPEENFPSTPVGLRSLAFPNKSYSYENINSIIWVTCWISTYYYHKDNEKRVHLIELLTNLPRMTISDKQRLLIITYITEAVGNFGQTEKSIFQNLSYLYHHVKNMLTTSACLSQTNKFILSSKQLDLGKEYHIANEQKPINRKGKLAINIFIAVKIGKSLDINLIKSKSSTIPPRLDLKECKSECNSSRDSSVNRSTVRIIRPYNLGKIQSADEDCIVKSHPKLLNTKPLKLSHFSKVQSTDNLAAFNRVSRKEKLKRGHEMQEKRNENVKPKKNTDMNPKEEAKNSIWLNNQFQKKEKEEVPNDIYMRDYKKMVSSVLKDIEPRLNVPYSEDNFEKRSMEQFKDSPNHQYFVFPVSHCSNCKERFSTKETKVFIKAAMPREKDKSLKENKAKEIENLKK